jgi:hypothetical protein
LPRRTSTYSGVLPDKISIFRGPITRLAAGDTDRLRREVGNVVLHEIAHHFGISDERLIDSIATERRAVKSKLPKNIATSTASARTTAVYLRYQRTR